MKIAYVFKSNMASTFQLGTMILPQLEDNSHLVNVVGMFSLDNGTGRRFLTKSEICLVVDNDKKN